MGLSAVAAPGVERVKAQAASGAAGAIECEVATDLAGLVRVQEELRRLSERVGQSSAAADPVRFLAELEAERAGPYVAVFRRGGEACGAILARLERRTMVCRVGYVRFRMPRLLTLAIVYGGMMAVDREAEGAVVEHVRGSLVGRHIQQVEVNRIDAGSAIAAELRGMGQGAATWRTDLHWRGRLLDSSGNRRIPVSGKTRNTMKRKDRKLVEACGENLSVRTVTKPEEVGEFTRAADSISALSYHGAIGVGVRDSDSWRAACRAMAESGKLRSYLLMAGERPVSYIMGIVHQRTFTLEATAFVPDMSSLSPGGVLLWRVLNDLVDAGVDVVDFGFGDAQYKQMYGTESNQDLLVRLYGSGARAGLVRLFDVWSGRAHRRLMWAANQMGVVDRVKRVWRRRLAAGESG